MTNRQREKSPFIRIALKSAGQFNNNNNDDDEDDDDDDDDNNNNNTVIIKKTLFKC